MLVCVWGGVHACTHAFILTYGVWGCLQGLQKNGRHYLLQHGLLLPQLIQYVIAKRGGKWGPRGDVPGISLLAQRVSEPSSAWLLSSRSHSSPGQRSCSLPSPVLTSSRKPFRTDLQTPSVQSVNPTTHSCSCTLRISPVETISPIGVYFVSRAELSLQEAAWQMRSLRDSFGAKDLSLNPSLPRPCSVASEKRLNLSEPWCFYL